MKMKDFKKMSKKNAEKLEFGWMDYWTKDDKPTLINPTLPSSGKVNDLSNPKEAFCYPSITPGNINSNTARKSAEDSIELKNNFFYRTVLKSAESPYSEINPLLKSIFKGTEDQFNLYFFDLVAFSEKRMNSI